MTQEETMERCRTNIVFCSFALSLCLVACHAMTGFCAEPLQKDQTAILRVNGEPITQEMLDQEMARYEGQTAVSEPSPDPGKKEAIRKKVLDGIVDRVLLLQESAKLGTTVTDEQVDEEMKRFKERFASPEQFQNMLARMKMSEAELRAEYRRRMAIRSLIEREVTPKAAVSDGEIKAFYDQNPSLFKVPERVRASHILAKTDPKSTDQDKAKAKEKIQSIKKRADAGEEFATLAIDNSDCPSAPKGGDLDYFQRGQMVAPFEDVAFSLKPGEMSDVVETQFGYHLIKIVDRQEAGVMPFDEMKPTIEDHLKQQKISDLLTAYVAELKSKAKIEVASK
jgi:peptidyl-prolyl cis-trans isomerase C